MTKLDEVIENEDFESGYQFKTLDSVMHTDRAKSKARYVKLKLKEDELKE
jgi:hypothetical protein